jgi:hypothetical protein
LIAIADFMAERARFHRVPYAAGYIAPAMHPVLADQDIDELVLQTLRRDRALITNRKVLVMP